jgi:hypothetical protein
MLHLLLMKSSSYLGIVNLGLNNIHDQVCRALKHLDRQRDFLREFFSVSTIIGLIYIFQRWCCVNTNEMDTKVMMNHRRYEQGLSQVN